eukprot:TRINITY_DN553_c0_g1_i1.p1 TRINITY_DN553_c0_g1~~TRINITY_DN553_c0_g1_i1.p1  ORF type:complete len:476 (+),score=181.94 TRINITY_DN553_c0_g1_i1:1643-3070(+)
MSDSNEVIDVDEGSSSTALIPFTALFAQMNGWSRNTKIAAGVGASVVAVLAIKWTWDAFSDEGDDSASSNNTLAEKKTSAQVDDILNLNSSKKDNQVKDLLARYKKNTPASASSSSSSSSSSTANAPTTAEGMFKSGMNSFQDACKHWETALSNCVQAGDEANARRARLYLGRAYSILALDVTSNRYGDAFLNSDTASAEAGRMIQFQGVEDAGMNGENTADDGQEADEVQVEEVDVASEMQEELSIADEIYDDPENNSRMDLLNVMKQLNDKYGEEPEVKWRLARAFYEVALDPRENNSDSEKAELLNRALSVVNEALEANDDNAGLHRWAGILLGALGDFVSTSEKIKSSYDIRDHWKRATEIDPSDASAHHLLGVWCLNIATISYIERMVASTAFGTPPTATYQDALDHFLKAETIDPGFYKKNLFYIGKVYYEQGEKSKARDYLNKALQLPTRTPEDHEDDAAAKKLLKKL